MQEEVTLYDMRRVRTIILNRPEKRNALNPDVVQYLHKALDAAATDTEIKAVVLTGAGTVFCAGADLEYLQQINVHSPEENHADSRALMEMLYALRTFPKPTIAKINGHALAGGCGLALACDILVASESARLGFTEVRIGFVPAIVMALAIEKIGAGKARELLLRGNQISASEALRIGMVHYTVSPQELDATVDAIAGDFADACSGTALRYTKQLFNDITAVSLRQAMEHSASVNALSRTSNDFAKGISAFLNKTKPEW